MRQDQVSVAASSQRPPITIYGYADKQRLLRREDYMPDNVTDQSNFTRWLPAEDDTDPWFSIDLGKVQTVVRTEFFLYRPTLGHAYQIESSTDGQHWTSVVNHTERQIRSPQIDTIDVTTRYLRMKFLEGHPGIWEMNIYGKSTGR